MAFAFTEKVPFLVHRKKLKSAANVDHKSPFSPQNCMRRGFDINHHAKVGEKRTKRIYMTDLNHYLPTRINLKKMP